MKPVRGTWLSLTAHARGQTKGQRRRQPHWGRNRYLPPQLPEHQEVGQPLFPKGKRRQPCPWTGLKNSPTVFSLKRRKIWGLFVSTIQWFLEAACCQLFYTHRLVVSLEPSPRLQKGNWVFLQLNHFFMVTRWWNRMEKRNTLFGDLNCSYLKHQQEVTYGAAGRVGMSLQILHLLYLSKRSILLIYLRNN